MLQIYHSIKSFIRHPILFLKTFSRIPRDNSDIGRWQKSSNLKEDWDSRTILIAGLIPAGSAVLEFGAGRFVLRDHLPPDCSYQPSDIVDRGDGTIVCDLNEDFPTLPRRYTHTVFSGVFEYVSDIGAVVGALKNNTTVIIASYSTTDMLSDYITRRRSGFINHLSNEQFISLFHHHGFRLSQTHMWQLQTIYYFEDDKKL